MKRDNQSNGGSVHFRAEKKAWRVRASMYRGTRTRNQWRVEATDCSFQVNVSRYVPVSISEDLDGQSEGFGISAHAC